MCTGDKIFHPCPCERTCTDVANGIVCAEIGDDNCISDCVCPIGSVELNGECVALSECPCYHTGIVYKVLR